MATETLLQLLKGKRLIDVSLDDLSEFVAMLRRQYAPASVGSKCSAVKSLFAFLHARGYIQSNPTEGIQSDVRYGRQHRADMLSHDDLAAIQRWIRSRAESAVEVRDRAVVQVLLDTMCKVHELVSLCVEDFDVEKTTLRFRMSGKKRTVEVASQTRKLLIQWLESREGAQPSEPLFNGRIGRSQRLTKNPLRRTSVFHLVRKRGEEVEVDSVTPTLLRHSSIGRALERGQVSEVRERTELHQHSLTRYSKREYRDWHSIVKSWRSPDDVRNYFGSLGVEGERWRNVEWLRWQAGRPREEGGIERNLGSLPQAIVRHFGTFKVFLAKVDGHLPFDGIESETYAHQLLRSEILRLREGGEWIVPASKDTRITQEEWDEISKPEWYRRNPVVRAVADFFRSQNEKS